MDEELQNEQDSSWRIVMIEGGEKKYDFTLYFAMLLLVDKRTEAWWKMPKGYF